MTLSFDLDGVATAEFGVGRDDGGERRYVAVPADDAVQAILVEMVAETWKSMTGSTETGGARAYEPSEKYASTEYALVAAGDPWGDDVRELHDAKNLDLDGDGLKAPERIFCYFARFADGDGRRLTGVRRATQFKGILKSRLIQLGTDTLQVVEDKVFKLDADFDLLVDEDNTHVWRAAGFESLANLTQQVLKAVPVSVSRIAAELPFLDLTGVESYAATRPRAARYLASIGSKQALAGITTDALVDLCNRTEVDVQKVNGKVHVAEGSEMGLLEVLDRRRYELALVPDTPERFRAASRTKIRQ